MEKQFQKLSEAICKAWGASGNTGRSPATQSGGKMWNKRIIPVVIIFAVGIFIITSGVIGAIKAGEKEIKEKEEALKDQGYEILKHETNYLDLSKRFDKTRSDYENLGQNYFNYKKEKERLEQENQRLKIQVSRGRARSLTRNAQPRRSAIPANTSLSRLANCESTNNPRAENGPYKGKYQYHPDTWANFSARAGLPGASIWDGAAQDKVTAWALSNGLGSHWGDCL